MVRFSLYKKKHHRLGTIVHQRRQTELSDITDMTILGRRSQRGSDIFDANPPPLFSLIINKKWDMALERIAAFPEEANFIDFSNRGWTALHWACSRDPPVVVVKALLHVNPTALCIRDDIGRGALSYACYRSSYEVVRTMLHIYHTTQDADSKRQHTIDALAYLCMEYNKEQMVNKTIGAWSRSHAFNDQAMVKVSSHDEQLVLLWRKVCLLLRAAYHGSVPGLERQRGMMSLSRTVGGTGGDWFSFSTIHACVGLDQCPTNLIKIAVELYPEQLREKDSKGRLPLHLISLPGRRNRCDGAYRAVIEGYPEAVTVRHPECGLYPFMLASIGPQACLDAAYRMLRICPDLSQYKVLQVPWDP